MLHCSVDVLVCPNSRLSTMLLYSKASPYVLFHILNILILIYWKYHVERVILSNKIYLTFYPRWTHIKHYDIVVSDILISIVKCYCGVEFGALCIINQI